MEALDALERLNGLNNDIRTSDLNTSRHVAANMKIVICAVNYRRSALLS